MPCPRLLLNVMIGCRPSGSSSRCSNESLQRKRPAPNKSINAVAWFSPSRNPNTSRLSAAAAAGGGADAEEPVGEAGASEDREGGVVAAAAAAVVAAVAVAAV